MDISSLRTTVESVFFLNLKSSFTPLRVISRTNLSVKVRNSYKAEKLISDSGLTGVSESDRLMPLARTSKSYHDGNWKLAVHMPQPQEITDLLVEWNNGDPTALDKLMPVVEAELRRIAGHHMRRESPGHTLQTTALVNEAYLKLVDQKKCSWQNRAHFFAIAAQLMRRILLDHARANKRTKRGGGATHVELDLVVVLSPEQSDDLLALDEALSKLATFDSLKSKIVEMRYFGGLSVEEAAEVLQVAPITIMRHWNLAKSWLQRELRGPNK